MLSHWIREFWRQSYSKRVPALPLALMRIIMGVFWFSQLSGSSQLSAAWFLCLLAGMLLSLGLLTKLGALIGGILTATYAAQSAMPAGQVLWPYALLLLIHFVLLTTGAGRSLGIDQLIVEKLANWPGNRNSFINRILAVL